MFRTALLAVLTCLLAACGGLEAATGVRDPFGTPQPFRGSGDAGLVGEVIGERAVYVGPITGLSEEAALSLRQAIATNAAALDVMASAETIPADSLTLTGAARGAAVDFTLSNQAAPVATFTAEGEPAILAALAARQLAEAVGRFAAPPPAAPSAATPATPGAPAPVAQPRRAPVIFIGEITAPDASKAAPLKRAISRSLAEMGAKIAENRADNAYVVTATLGIGHDTGGRTGIAIVWRVLAPDGTDLGKAEQNNALATEAVQKNWAEQATLAGNAAARSVARLIAGHFNRAK